MPWPPPGAHGRFSVRESENPGRNEVWGRYHFRADEAVLFYVGCYRGLYTDSRFEVCGCLINLWLGTSWLSLKRVLVLMSDGLVSVRIQLDLGNHGIVRHLFTGFGGEKGCEWPWFFIGKPPVPNKCIMKVIRFQHIGNPPSMTTLNTWTPSKKDKLSLADIIWIHLVSTLPHHAPIQNVQDLKRYPTDWLRTNCGVGTEVHTIIATVRNKAWLMLYHVVSKYVST